LEGGGIVESGEEQVENVADERLDETSRLRGLLGDALATLDAPDGQYARLGLDGA
jgi:hypothetical protein